MTWLAVALVACAPKRASHPSTYVGSERCGSCHPSEYAAWRGSHHALAMQPATDQTVLGDFSDASIHNFRFSRRGPAFVVSADGVDRDVAYVFGVDPLQQLLVPFPDGRLQAVSVAWDTRARRWFSLSQDAAPAGDWLHWTRGGQTWNTMCADCHSTNVAKNFDADTGTFRTTWSELSVGCEACHGAGGRRPTPAGGPALVERCAPCHARRAQIADQGAPDQPLLDRYLPALLSAGAFHADGQILDEDYEVQSFEESKMYARGVSCVDCHDVHSGKLRADGNALCTRCHQQEFDTSAHTGHASAIGCASCHMPGRDYMVVHLRRDHSMRVPQPPDADAAIGAPSACAQAGCHADKPATWLASAWTSKFGARPAHDHWGALFAAARRGDPSAITRLAAIVTDPSRAAIVRASALELLGGYEDPPSPPFEVAASDPEPIVRFAAAASAHDVSAIAALAGDPVRGVRITAAARLAEAGRGGELREYVAAQRYLSDLPSGPYNLGNLYAVLGRRDEAERQYRAALAIDDRSEPAEVNLAMLLAGEGRADEARAILRHVLTDDPDQEMAAYDLKLLAP
jgi:predicted CXXCH cytochrome family protein